MSTCWDPTREGRRLLQTQAYFDFMASKMPGVIEEWHASKDALVDEMAKRHTSSA